MTPQQLFGVVVRLFALWLALKSVPWFTTIPATFRDAPEGTPFGSWHVVGAAHLAVAVALWLFPMAVARRLVPDVQQANRPPSFSAHDLARVGCALVGVWSAAISLPALVDAAYQLLANESSLEAVFSGREMPVDALQLALGIVLVAMSNTFATFVVPSSRNQPGA